MKTFLRVLAYILPYRYRFALGVLFSFLAALLSGAGLSAFVPIFEALGNSSSVYLSQFSTRERKILNQAFGPGSSVLAPIRLPPAPEKIDQKQAQALLSQLRSNERVMLPFLSDWELNTLLRGKLQISAAGFSPLQLVFFTCLLIIPLYALKLFLVLLCIRLITSAGYSAVRRIRNDLYVKVQRLPLSWFYKSKSGEVVSRLSNDAEIIAVAVSSKMSDAITNTFYILVYVLLLAYLNLQLLLISIVTIPVILFPITLLAGKIRKSVHHSQHFLAELHGHLQEAISGMKLVRFMQTENHESQRFRHINDRLYWRRFKENYYNSLGPYLVELNSVVVTLGVLSLGAFFLDPSDFTTGEFLAFITILLFIVRPVIQLSGMYASIQGAITAGRRIFEMMDQKFETRDPSRPLPLQRLHNSIRFTDLCFRYPETERQVLHDINLEVPVGSTIAFVGESGGGKSTLMDLLAGFFRPTRGQILLDGQSIQNFRIADHRSRIAIVTQEIFLFHGTIHNNIAYGKRNASPREVEKAARLAHAHDFICGFPEGYHTLLGNRGLNLSGGQRQRIAIARALLRDPEILLLDEATSSLDAQSEHLIQHALERLFHNRTTFTIAHRLSTIKKADIIVVISEGRIVEQGNHETLLQRDGYYAQLQNIHRSAGVALTK